MGHSTHIAWCDHTSNFWSGCTKVSPGCLNCYAEARDKRHMIEKVDHWGKGAPRLKGKSAVKQCFTWNKKPWICDECGFASPTRPDENGLPIMACPHCHRKATWHRARVFSLSLGDWLDPEVPVSWLAEMLDTVLRCENLDFLLCTKRPEMWSLRVTAARNFLTSHGDADTAVWLNDWLPKAATSGHFIGRQAVSDSPAKPGKAPKNVWVLTSTENQEMLDKRVPELLKIPAVVHGLSCEPLLGPLNLGLRYTQPEDPPNMPKPKDQVDWVIVGGESGPNARACDVTWIEDMVDQCSSAEVACFVKQLGKRPVDGTRMSCDSDRIPLQLKDKKGGKPAEWPESMRVRQFPEVTR